MAGFAALQLRASWTAKDASTPSSLPRSTDLIRALGQHLRSDPYPIGRGQVEDRPALLYSAQLTDVATAAEVVEVRSRHAANGPPVTTMVSQGVTTGAVSRTAAASWLREVRAAAAAGAYMSAVTVHGAAGRRL
jgi:hypothetical protein